MDTGEKGRWPTHPEESDLVGFSDEFLEKMDDHLEGLLLESKAKCAMVIDRSGCILSSAGDFHPLSQENMGAMAAGVIAALNAMVSQASSPEVSIKFYGAEIDKVHYVVLADRLILCMLLSRHATSGQIRQAARNFTADILPLIARERASSQQTNAGDLLKSVQYIESKLNEMFLDPG